MCIRDSVVPDHHLSNPGGVAQVEERHAAVIPAPVDPARERDGLADLLGSQRAGGVGAQHGIPSRAVMWCVGRTPGRVSWRPCQRIPGLLSPGTTRGHRSASGGCHRSGSAGTWSPVLMSLTSSAVAETCLPSLPSASARSGVAGNHTNGRPRRPAERDGAPDSAGRGGAGARGDGGRGQGHQDRRPGAGRPRAVAAAGRRPVAPRGPWGEQPGNPLTGPPLDLTGRPTDAPHHGPGRTSVLRTHTAGSLRAEQIGRTVTLAGWVDRRRDHGGVAFLDLRDASGIAQVVIRDDAVAHGLRNEYVLQVTGTVGRRPEGNENPGLATGAIELTASEVVVLNECAPLPFQVSSSLDETVGEEARFKYRYLDLRRPKAAHAMRLRARMSAAARRVLDANDFVEVETPTLTRSTPEGARDFVVPARLSPGSWYALPQSPQLFKQLLMVGGLERYYQIARCYRAI